MKIIILFYNKNNINRKNLQNIILLTLKQIFSKISTILVLTIIIEIIRK